MLRIRKKILVATYEKNHDNLKVLLTKKLYVK